jgi:hypothetical protein
LLSAFGALIGAPLFASPALAAQDMAALIPVVARHQGTWEGTYRSLTPQLQLIDAWTFRIVVSLGQSAADAYRQHTTYRWPNGKTSETSFTAALVDGHLTWADARIKGTMHLLGPEAMLAEMQFTADPDGVIMEMARIAADGAARSRVGMVSRRGVLEKIQIADERRVA